MRGDALFKVTIRLIPIFGKRMTPLIHWWNKYSAYHGLSPTSTPGHTIAKLDGETITAAGVNFRLHRTLRVPDNSKKNNLPPVRIHAEFQFTLFSYNILELGPISPFSGLKICSSSSGKHT